MHMRNNSSLNRRDKDVSVAMIARIVAVFAVLSAASGGAFATGDVAAGKNKSNACVVCHGATGVSTNEAWPNLTGQKQAYLVKQLKAFRDGTRTDPLMSPVATPLSDEDIDDLTTYFSTQTAAPAAPIAAQLPSDSSAVPHVAISPSDVVKVRPHPTRQYWADMMPEAEGRAVIVQKCQLCHDLQKVLSFARPKEQWQGVVDAMNGRGSPVTAEEKPIIVDYLTKYFGFDSAPILSADGVQEVGKKPCKPSEWPKGSSDFRSNWKGSYNIWVSGQEGGTVDIVDPITRNIVRRIRCVSAPDRVEFSRDGNTAYAPDRVEHNITIIDTRTGAIKAKVPLIDRPNTAVLSRDYKKLYAGIWPLRGDEDKRGYIQVLDTTTLKVVKTMEVNGGIHDTWMSPDGKLLLAMSPPGKFLDLFDTKTDKLIWVCCHEAEIGTMNMEAGRDGATSRIFFSYSGYPGVVVVDPKTGQELKRAELYVDTEGPSKGVHHQPPTSKGFGFHGGEISADGKDYWVTAGSYVYRFELPSLRAVGDVHLARIDQAGNPFTPAVEGSWLTISPDGQKVYAVRPGRDLLSEIDAKTMKEVALIPTGEYPLHISLWPRGTP
jgi:YVTN family beta-propeller protein